MFGDIADRVAGLVENHDLSVILVLLVLTAGVAAGLPQLNIAEQTDIDDDAFDRTAVGQALSYLETNYGDDDGGGTESAISSVYVQPADGNALSRESLLAALAYQEAVLSDPVVERELLDGGIGGPPTLVGRHLAGDDASVADQRAAIETASEEELRGAIRATLGDPAVAGQFLPRSYEPSDVAAESMRVQFTFRQADVTQQQEPLPAEDAQRTLYEEAGDRSGVFTMGSVAQAEWDSAQITDVFWLIVPPALVLVLAVLAFAYRDLVDVLLGFVGVCVSLVWFFGILGWLGVAAGFASIVGPVLIVALSVDFGLHVFMRYREQRGPDEGVQAPIGRSTASVMVAFVLVAVTAGVGFLANVTSPIGFIRVFGVVITLGVLSAALVFVTLVPALKVRIDTTLERHGVDRRKTALGSDGRLQRFLTSGVTLARHGAVVVLVVSVVVGAVGLFAYTGLDRQGFQQEFATDDDWQTALPGPVGWSAHETDYRENLDYVQRAFQSDDDRKRFTSFLLRGDVTDVAALERVHAGTTAAHDSDVTFRQGETVPVVSPLSLLRTTAVEDDEFAGLLVGVAESNERFADLLSTLAAEDEAFAAALERAEPAPVDGDVTQVYDALFERVPADASRVLERSDGEYASMRLVVPVEQGLGVDERGEAMHAIADGMVGDSDHDVVPVGFATVSNAGLGAIADSILWTMLLAFVGVALVLAATFRLEHGSATLGAVTVVPVALVVGVVFGGMYLFGVPLTFVTAFLVSITIGLGIDYTIHVSDRFAQELARGRAPVEALTTTVTGTGGALLGSALTSGAAFATLLLHPSAVFRSFGFIVVAALLLSFAVSVLVFPSLLLWWSRRVDPELTA